MTVEEFKEVMSGRTDADLIKIVTIEKDQFQPNAIIAAEEELKKRNLTIDQTETIKSKIEGELKAETDKANEPLEIHWRVLTFIIPGLLNIIFSGAYHADGFQRKAAELRKWTLYGFGFYLSLILLVLIIDSFG